MVLDHAKILQPRDSRPGSYVCNIIKIHLQSHLHTYIYLYSSSQCINLFSCCLWVYNCCRNYLALVLKIYGFLYASSRSNGASALPKDSTYYSYWLGICRLNSSLFPRYIRDHEKAIEKCDHCRHQDQGHLRRRRYPFTTSDKFHQTGGIVARLFWDEHTRPMDSGNSKAMVRDIENTSGAYTSRTVNERPRERERLPKLSFLMACRSRESRQSENKSNK